MLEERVAGSYNPRASGNNLLYQLMGVEAVKVVPAGSDLPAEMTAAAEELTAQGRKGHTIPVGGSTPTGALGYVACAEEILAQAFELGLAIDRVVCPSGSAGTHAGLVTGFWGNHSPLRVVGINVSRPKAAQEELVHALACRTAAKLGIAGTVPRQAVCCFGDYVGPGYSLPTPGMVEAVKLVARTEAILLDPVYTGKAMAGLIDLVRTGYFSKNETLLFVHTGGSPALYAYLDSFLG